jgi:hypothetical protein
MKLVAVKGIGKDHAKFSPVGKQELNSKQLDKLKFDFHI